MKVLLAFLAASSLFFSFAPSAKGGENEHHPHPQKGEEVEMPEKPSHPHGEKKKEYKKPKHRPVDVNNIDINTKAELEAKAKAQAEALAKAKATGGDADAKIGDITPKTGDITAGDTIVEGDQHEGDEGDITFIPSGLPDALPAGTIKCLLFVKNNRGVVKGEFTGAAMPEGFDASLLAGDTGANLTVLGSKVRGEKQLQRCDELPVKEAFDSVLGAPAVPQEEAKVEFVPPPAPPAAPAVPALW